VAALTDGPPVQLAAPLKVAVSCCSARRKIHIGTGRPALTFLAYRPIQSSGALLRQDRRSRCNLSDRDPRWLMLILWLIGVVAPVGFTIWILYAAYYWPARLHEMRAPRAIPKATP